MSHPRDPTDQLWKEAVQCHRRGDLASAAALLTQILEIDANHSPALLAKGDICAQRGNFQQALALFKRASLADRHNPAAFVQVGRVLQALGRLDEALDTFNRAITLNPGTPELYFCLGNLQSQRGAYDKASQAYLKALHHRPDFAQASCNLGAIYKEQGKLHQAVKAYRQAISADPGLATAYANLGSALRELGDVDASVQVCRKATSLAPHSAQGFANLGVALKDAGLNEQAVVALRQALTIEPRWVDSHLNLGNALRTLNRTDEAYACYERVTEIQPNHAQARASQVAILLEKGEPDRALELCDYYLAEFPYNSLLNAARTVTLNTLGYKDQLSTLLNMDEILYRYKLTSAPSYHDLQQFNRELSQHIRSHPSLTHSPTSHATRAGQHTGELLAGHRGPMDIFEEIARQQMDVFLSSNHSSGYMAAPSTNIRVNMWGVVMHQGGHQVPHIHPTAWMSGVYYPQVPDSVGWKDDSGWIEFGRVGREFPSLTEPQLLTVKPEEGLMLLFPSYLYHRTIPLRSEKPRISIAFDFIRES